MNDNCVFEAYITNLGKYNEGYLIGEHVKFPTTYEELQKVFERIGINEQYEEWFITDYECPISRMYDMLGEYESLDELNYLASKIDEMDNGQLEKFQAAAQMGEHTGSLKDLINLTENLDCYDLIEDVHNDYDLGYYWIEESGSFNLESLGELPRYIDYESYGRDIGFGENGAFTDYGYVYDNGGNFIELYDGSREDIPDEYRVTTSSEEQEFYQNQPVISDDELDTVTELAFDLDEFFRAHSHEYAYTFSEGQEKKEELADCLLEGRTVQIKNLLADMAQGDDDVLPLRLAEYEKEFSKDLYLIYQLKQDDSTRDLRFEPLERLHKTGHIVDKKNYELVYSAELTPADTPEGIYTEFNLNHPNDFTGHSLSVSDIVVFKENGKETAYYCDSTGFTVVPEFYYVETISACRSNYKDMTAFVGADDKVYIGKSENYIYNYGDQSYYNNADSSLLLVSENKNMYYYLYSEGWLASQDEMIKQGFCTQEDYAEYAKLQSGILSQFEQTREFLFDGKPFNHLETAEKSTEQNYNQIDSIINNEKPNEKPSIKEQLNNAKKECGEKNSPQKLDKSPPEL